MPRLDALIATTAGTLATQRILDLVWEHLLPALEQEADSMSAGAALAFPGTSTGAADAPRAHDLDGVTFVLGEPFTLPTRFYGGEVAIVSAAMDFADEATCIALTDGRATYRLPIGVNTWAGGTSPVSTGYPEPYKGLARWEAPDRLAVDLVFTEGGFRMTFVFGLDPVEMTLKTPANPGLEGREIIGRPFP